MLRQEAQELTIDKQLQLNQVLIIFIRNKLEVQDSMQELLDISSQFNLMRQNLNVNSSVKLPVQLFLLNTLLLSKKLFMNLLTKALKQVILLLV